MISLVSQDSYSTGSNPSFTTLPPAPSIFLFSSMFSTGLPFSKLSNAMRVLAYLNTFPSSLRLQLVLSRTNMLHLSGGSPPLIRPNPEAEHRLLHALGLLLLHPVIPLHPPPLPLAQSTPRGNRRLKNFYSCF